MSLLEIIKNPAKFIYKNNSQKPKAQSPQNFNEIKPKIENEVLKNENSNSFLDTIISDCRGFEQAVKTSDFHWILRGKTGFVIKFVLPIICVIYLFQNIYVQGPKVETTAPPPVVDTGDTLVKPAYVNQNYLFATQENDKFYLFSPTSKKTLTFGVRGLPLGEMALPEGALYVIKMSENSYFYVKDEDPPAQSEFSFRPQYLYFYKITKEKNPSTGKIEEKIIDKKVLLKNPLLDIEFTTDYRGLIVQKSTDGNLILYGDNLLFVINDVGDVLFSKSFPVATKIYNATHYGDSVYYVEKVYNEFDSRLVRLNSNGEEIFSLPLKYYVEAFQVINNDRFLFVYFFPSGENEKLVYHRIEMVDSKGSVVFSFVPEWSKDMIVHPSLVYFEPLNNNIFLFGEGAAQLFTVTGRELWTN